MHRMHNHHHDRCRAIPTACSINSTKTSTTALNRSIEENDVGAAGASGAGDDNDDDGPPLLSALRIGRSEIPSNSTILFVPPGMDRFSNKRSAIRRA
eukprot:jgi/Psemu1/302967/fgenesh1_kg.87_\